MMMFAPILALSVIAACGVGLAEGMSHAQVVGVQPESEVPALSVEIADENLANALAVTDVRTRRIGPVIQAEVRLENTGRREIIAQYHFEWLDDGGFGLASVSETWVPVGIAPGSVFVIRETSRHSDAQSGRVRIQPRQ